MGVESEDSARTGNSIIWAGSDGDVKFDSPHVEHLVLSAAVMFEALKFEAKRGSFAPETLALIEKLGESNE